MKPFIRLSLLALMLPASAWADHIQSDQADREVVERFIDPTDLSDFERQALNYYTANGYKDINTHLRRHKAAKVQPTISYIDSALQKFPVYTKTLYRGERPNFHHLLPKKGEEIKELGYLSTSRNPVVAKRFGSIQYEIHALNCRDISRINFYEDEVICPRGTVFKVRSVKSDGNVTQYVLDEVTPNKSKN